MVPYSHMHEVELENLFGKQDEVRGHMLEVELNSLDLKGAYRAKEGRVLQTLRWFLKI